MKRLLAITLILSLATATAVVAQPAPQGLGDCDRGQPGHQSGGKMDSGHPGGGIRSILAHGDEIGLTADQRDKLQKMHTTFKMECVDQKAKVDKARIKLQALMRDEADEGQVNAAIDEMFRFQAELKKMQYRHRTETKSVLTADQLEKLESLQKKCRQKGHNCRGHSWKGKSEGKG